MLKKIFVLDDDKAVLEMIEAALTYEQFEVRVQSKATNLLETIEEYKPDVVLIDYFLDTINGGEYCHQIKCRPHFHNVSVIMISAYPKVFESLENYGCDSFIAKPFDLSTLIETINNCLIKKGIYHA